MEILRKIIAIIVILLLLNCSKEPIINKVVEYELAGVCIKCPYERLDSILRSQEGILKIEYDENNTIIKISFDSTYIKEHEIINLLNDNGYDVGVNIAVIISNMSPCCEELLGNITVTDTTDTTAYGNNMGGSANSSTGNVEEESIEDLLEGIPESPEEKVIKSIPPKTIDEELSESIEGDIDMAEKEIEKLAEEIEKAEDIVQDEELEMKIDLEKAIKEALEKQKKQKKPNK